ncbi:hypothetical protein LI328DRAFT_13113 [Trichoderma asperelloides]|nr:hypothetical protein LI328DRAFT_13113 [Trichoderma asperelloides]
MFLRPSNDLSIKLLPGQENAVIYAIVYFLLRYICCHCSFSFFSLSNQTSLFLFLFLSSRSILIAPLSFLFFSYLFFLSSPCLILHFSIPVLCQP